MHVLQVYCQQIYHRLQQSIEVVMIVSSLRRLTSTYEREPLLNSIQPG